MVRCSTSCLCLLFVMSSVSYISSQKLNQDRNFFIDFERNTFIKDSQPFRYISGSIHPYRVPNELWEDRLNKIWASGLNAVQIYIFWNEHEPFPGVYDFDGQRDIFRFINLTQQIGLNVLLRVGPYACGEHEYGALPWWLLSNGVDKLRPRTSEGTYMEAVKRWYQVLLPKILPWLYKNGGPVLTVQVENEYGSYYACDRVYTSELRDIFRKNLEDDVIYYTTDGDSVDYLKCGVIPGVYPTVDFGPGTNVTEAFQSQRAYAPFGPLVNSEYYTGWLDLWGQPHAKVAIGPILKTLIEMLNVGANVNMYMFHGGTNFGFSNGADPKFQTQPTSYDYDSPLTEAGDVTDKYMAIRAAVSKFLPIPKVPIPVNSTKVAYGKIAMPFYVPLVEVITSISDHCVDSLYPLSFEELGQGYGFVMYKTKLLTTNVDGQLLLISNLRDRAYIQIGLSYVGVLDRNGANNLTIDLPNNKNDTLFIIVENMGRLNFGNDMLDNKGILDGVELNGQNLTQWTTCLTQNFVPNYQNIFGPDPGLDKNFKDFVSVYKNEAFRPNRFKNVDFRVPAVYIGEFDTVNATADTFLKMDKFTKGVALIRSIDRISNLGRYWPKTGPQVTLYTPSAFVTPASRNTLALIEFEGSACQTSDECFVEFIDYPIIDSIPSNGKPIKFN